jgi:hypothetical protein
MLFAFLKRVYAVRSALAHGGVPKPSDCRDRHGAQATPTTLTNDFEDVVRAALRAALKAKRTGQWPPDWEALLFGVRAAPAAQPLDADE